MNVKQAISYFRSMGCRVSYSHGVKTKEQIEKSYKDGRWVGGQTTKSENTYYTLTVPGYNKQIRSSRELQILATGIWNKRQGNDLLPQIEMMQVGDAV